MKFYRNILMIGLASFFIVSLVSCQKEENSTAMTVLASESYLKFEAKSAEPKTIDIFSDGKWEVESPDWVMTSLKSGDGHAQGMTITVADNVDEKGINYPRRDTIRIHGEKLMSYAYVIIDQAGNPYRGVKDMTIGEILKVKDGETISLISGQVVARNKMGLLLYDGHDCIMVQDISNYQLGDWLAMKGKKGTELGLPVILGADEIELKKSGAPEFPSVTDISNQLDTFKPESMQFVSIIGLCSMADGGNYLISSIDEDVKTQVLVFQPDPALKLNKLNGHKVIVQAFVIGKKENVIHVVAASVEDRGVYETIYFEDDFSWIQPWADASSAGDAVGDNNPSSSAPNVYTKDECVGFVEELVKRGYVDLNESPHVVYLQKYYLKFGKTSNNTGLTLPPCKFGDNPVDVKISFDWCPQLTGKKDKQDPVKLVLEIAQGPGEFANGQKVSVEMSTNLSLDSDNLFVMKWIHEEVVIKGVTNDTRINIRNHELFQSGKFQNRYYLDNIKIVPEK